MNHIGILNLTRFGDLIQTSPVLTGLRKRWPEARLHLIVKRRFASAARLVPAVDAIHEVDGDALAGLLSDPELPFLDRFRGVRRAVDALRGVRFDLLLNFTHSRASGVLMSLLEARERRGFGLDREGQRRVDDAWLGHVAVMIRARRLALFNLVDVYLGAAGLVGRGERLSVRIPEGARELAAASLSGEDVRVGLQLGASQDVRAWEVERFAATLRRLVQGVPGVRLVLLGVPAEAERAAALRGACPELHFVDLIGRTDVGQLAAVVERLDLLLTGDTGTMHLAAAVGTPTLGVYLGHAWPPETSAYAEGHWIVRSQIACAPCRHTVSCGHPVCHEDVEPEWLGEVAARIVRRERVEDAPRPARAALLRTGFDEHGLHELVPAHARAATPEDLLALAYRSAFLETLARIPADLAQARARAFERFGVKPGAWSQSLPAELPAELARLAGWADEAERGALELATELPDAARARALGARLAACDAEVFGLARARPLLAPLGLALEEELQRLPETDLCEQAGAAACIYRALGRRARVLDSLVRGESG